MSLTNALFLGNADDGDVLKSNASSFKAMFNGWNTFVLIGKVEMLTQLEMYCAKRNITAIVTTSTEILRKLVDREGSGSEINNPKLSDYAGSLFTYKNLEIVFVSPLRQLFTVSYGKFLAARYISKVVDAESWQESTAFQWSLLTPENIDEAYVWLAGCYGIATDIETARTHLAIRCIGYTGVSVDSEGKLETRSFVLPIDSGWALAWMRKINSLPVQKIFQRGKYDNSYLLRYHAEPTCWLWDTANLFHSWYSELPKDLGFLNAFFLRKVVYWKDLAETNDLSEYYRYNAIDTWATANVWIQCILKMPDWARRNYVLEFPLNFPCLLAEMTGLRRDQERLENARKILDTKIDAETGYLRRILGRSDFNPNSPKMVLELLTLLGCRAAPGKPKQASDINSTEEPELKKAMFRHPLNGFVLGKILDVRGWRKLASTYLRLETDKEGNKGNGAKEFCGRVLYSLNPDATDTARLASQQHHFWCGLQIHNIPTEDKGKEVKETLACEEGFEIFECDLKQAETWDEAHITGDETLLHNIKTSPDFHKTNAVAFFGLAWDAVTKPIRYLSKRTNHGANYNMGGYMLVDTMGLENIWNAKKLLKLPYQLPEEIGEHLITVFHLTYTTLRGPIKLRSSAVQKFLRLPDCNYKLYSPGTFFAKIAEEVELTQRITSRAWHHTDWNLKNIDKDGVKKDDAIQAAIKMDGDWTRYTFGKPQINKMQLNAYIAHPAQSLNSRTLNEAWMAIFYQVALKEPVDFRLFAQIHDSVLGATRMGRRDLQEKVQALMEIPVTVRDVHGTFRTFTVPADLKRGKDGSEATYWSQLE